MLKGLKMLAAAAIAAMAIPTAAAAVKDLPVKTVNGRIYHYYQVPEKETVYSICYKLQVTKEDLIRYNPAVEDGLRVGMTIYFPFEGEQPQQPKPSAVTHNVVRGETIFGISHKYGITEQQLIDMNPVLKNGLKAGQTLTITGVKTEEPAPASVTAVAEEPMDVTGYVVRKGETLYSIAVKNGITVAMLEEANPGLQSLKAGQVINIPVRKETPETPEAETPAPVVAEVVPEAEAAPVVAPAAKSVTVAVMLPFMLSEETPSKGAQRYTEFYKGFLLAVDSLRHSGTPIHITTFDTEGSLVKVKEILTQPGFTRPDAIIAPENPAQLAILAEYGKNNGVKVLNSFVVRDDSYVTNPQMIQGNLPSSLMYRRAVNALVERLRHSTPVFLGIEGVQGDKEDFVAELRAALDSAGIPSCDITADGSLTVADLRQLDADGNYTFIPVTSRQADLNRLMPAIIDWRDEAVTPIVRLFGYPEWTTFRGETLSNMHNLNTTVYSRFFADYDDADAEALDGKFRSWYGSAMEPEVPRQGLMGFDAGMFLIPYLTGGPAKYDGIQNGYRITRASADGGLYNDMLYFINFRPGGAVSKTAL